MRIRPAARRFAPLLALLAVLVSGGVVGMRALLGLPLAPDLPDTGARVVPTPLLGAPVRQVAGEVAQPLCRIEEPRHHADESLVSAPPVQAVPILVYHYIRPSSEPPSSLGYRLSVSPHDFAAQMALLRSRGAHAITLGQLAAAMAGRAELPAHPVVLTFDDGYYDFFSSALPVLRHQDMCATLFAVPGFLGRPAYLTADQLKAVARAGVAIGAHTMTHPDLATLSPTALADEVSRSGAELRSLTGQPVADFAYPYGHYDDAVVAAVQAAGYADAVTMQAFLPETDQTRYTLPRLEVIGGEPLDAFAQQAGV